MLLAGTALVSTLIAAAPTPASAQIAVFRPLSPFLVNVTNHRNCIFPGTCALINTILPGASIDFTNTGNFAVIGFGASAIYARTNFGRSHININNSGDLATIGFGAIGIQTVALGRRSPINIVNSGDIATAGINAYGIFAYGGYRRSDITITNSGDIATVARNADGIFSFAYGPGSDTAITNSGEIATRGRLADGIYTLAAGPNSNITVTNSGKITTRGAYAAGINAYTIGFQSNVSIVNSGDIETRGFFSAGIYAGTSGPRSSLTIQNSGNVTAKGVFGFGIYAGTTGPASPLTIENSGDVHGTTAGIFAYSATSTKIVNSGSIGADSNRAINTVGASTTIENTGLITGFVDLTNSPDTFINTSGGEFRAERTSRFRGGHDLFENRSSGVLRTADQYHHGEETTFTGLERFQNEGLITMVDGRDNDVFRISNTPGGKDSVFHGSGHSTLAVDTFIGGRRSTSDILIIEGDAKGQTQVAVNNTNPGAGRYDPVGIPVVFVEGKKVNKKNFYLDKPIDSGFFDYDLIFRPTGSGVFELKSHPGGGSHILPHVVTAGHETFHHTTETWFDQTADLRVLLAQGAVCDDPVRVHDREQCQSLYSLTPAVWARGSGSWFDLEDNGKTKTDNNTYRYTLDRNFDVMTLESGIDFGKRDFFTQGDILVFGLLGGAVESTLDYKALARSFDIEGSEVGAYATYLNGGLFVDTLFKTIFSTVDPRDVVGFPDTFDHTTYGVRADAGYRFGGVHAGPFIEPLATIVASWIQVDDFAREGTTVNFDDDENVVGRVGLRLGTDTEVWKGTTMEPFVIGSLWGTLSGSHSATVTSGNTAFTFVDEADDLWGTVSAGVNFFNPGAQTTVFAKLDYTFGDQTEGVSAKGGMRYNW